MQRYPRPIPSEHPPEQCEGCYYAETMAQNVQAYKDIANAQYRAVTETDRASFDDVREKAGERYNTLCSRLGSLATLCSGGEACFITQLPEHARYDLLA